MDDTEPNVSIDSVEVGPSSPRALATPRIPILLRDSPLSTKREKSKMTPKFRRPAPKVIKTAPPIRSFYSVMRDPLPRLVTSSGSTLPIRSPIYDQNKQVSFFEQTFSVIEIIGKGSFGEVFSARCHEDNRMYAVKVSINLLRHNSHTKYREVENHMSLPSHYNLVEFHRAWEESDRLYIQTELCERSLLSYCTQKHYIPERQIWNIFIDLLQAIDHLHSHDMIHDDIKPDNILLTRELVCKLGDFGLAVNLRKPLDVLSAEEGDSKYLAPEVLNGKPTKSSDIFSLGMTILEAATDLDVPSNGAAWHSIRKGEIPDRFFAGISKELRSLIEWMLQRDPTRRPTTKDLLDYPAIKKRLMKRHLFVKYVGMRDSLKNFLFILLTWTMAFCAVLFQHPIAMFQAVSVRRNAICAKMSNQSQLQQQQHTPIQTPEASKAFAESLTDNSAAAVLIRNPAAPFDFSDDENPSNIMHIQRRLFPVQNPVSRLNFDDDDDDEEQATSSSNSSAIESTSSPVPSSFRSQEDWMSGRQGTPKSARKIILPPFGLRPTTPAVSSTTSPRHHHHPHHHGGSGDGFSNEDRAAWMNAKYQRMMNAESRMDTDDNDNDVIDETPLIQMPVSCPPIAMRMGRRFLRAPKLDFSLLDGDDKDDKKTTTATTTATATDTQKMMRRDSESPERTSMATAPPPITGTPKGSKSAMPTRRPLRMTRARMRSFQGSSGDEA